MIANSNSQLPSPLKRNLCFIFLITAVAIGITARFWDLSGHFTNTDDLGIIEVTFEAHKAGNIFHLPATLTNAPFQYVLTYFLLSEKMAYEQLLFWARLPSCLFGCGALIVLVLFYLDFTRKGWTKIFFALAILACSWEAIIFAKQAHSYSVGILTATLLCLLLINQMRRDSGGRVSPAVLGLLLALLGSMQYQTIIFLPAFFLSLFLYRRADKNPRADLIKSLGISAAAFGVLFFPVWHFFLKAKSVAFHTTLDWTLGPNREFAFPSLESENIFGALLKSALFYLKNFYFIFESKISFIPDSSPLLRVTTAALLALFCLGVFHFFVSRNRKTRFMGVFFGVSLLTWWVLVPLKHFPYTPSRHTLILLPFLCITIAEGPDGLRRLLKKIGAPVQRLLYYRIPAIAGIFILGLFLLFYPHFLRERKNPIAEKDVCGLIEKYKVDSLLFDRRSLHLEYMGCVRDLADKQDRPGEVRTFASVSRYPGVSAQERCGIFKQLNNVAALDQLRSSGTLPMVMKHDCPEYKMIYQKEIDTGVMEGFNRDLKADIYGNRLYFYILSLDPPPAEPSVS